MPTLTVIAEQCLAPVPGGTGRYAREITRALAAAPRPGWQVGSVVAWHRDVRAAVIPGVVGPRRLPAGRRLLHELWLHGLPPTVRGSSVHATTPLAPNGGPLVVTVHDAVPWTHPETLTPRGVGWHRAMVARAAQHAAAIVVPSQAVADDIGGLFPAAAGRLHVVGHGVTDLPTPPDAADRRRRMGLPAHYVLSVATLEPRKGLDVLVDAVAALAVDGPHLAVVGPSGWGGVNLAQLAADKGLPVDRLHILGRLDDTDLAAVLAGASLLVAPARSEGFGLPVLEAMSAGIPVVISDAPALVELAGGTAIVVPRDDPAALADAVGSVLNDRAAADALAHRGRLRARDFTWAAAAEQLWDLHVRLAAVA